MPNHGPIERRTYELTSWLVPGPFEPIPLLLYHRSDLPGPKPAAVYYHGVVQAKEVYLDTHPMSRHLADAGFVVALPDAPGHGARSNGATVVQRLRESLAHEFCVDIERAGDEAAPLFDWLLERPEIDGRRLGVLGVSMGGYTAAVVAARVRERLGAAVCIAGCGDLATCMAETDSIGSDRWGPLDRSVDAETRDRIARIDPLGYPDRYVPLPLLVLHGERDTWNPPVTARRFVDAVQPFYASNPSSFRFVLVPNAPHWPPPATMIQEAVDWLRQHVAD